MIIRVALFISLVALFYSYCNEDGLSNQQREPDDINMIEVPVELNPTYNYESIPEAALQPDSSRYILTTYFTNLN